MSDAPKPYTLHELQRHLAANSFEFGGWGLDTARWYATIDDMNERLKKAERERDLRFHPDVTRDLLRQRDALQEALTKAERERDVIEQARLNLLAIIWGIRSSDPVTDKQVNEIADALADARALRKAGQAVVDAAEERVIEGSHPRAARLMDALRLALRGKGADPTRSRQRTVWDEAMIEWGEGPRTMKETADWANRWVPRLCQEGGVKK